jgi:hypothetical protein
MGEESIRYTPSPEHRFVISPDIISQQRFRLVQGIAHDLAIFESYRETTVKGSLTKGKVLTEDIAAKTDIDIGIIFDANAVLNQREQQLQELAQWQGLEVAKPDLSPIKPSENIHNLFASQNLNSHTLRRLRLARDLAKRFIGKQTETKSKELGIALPKVDPKVFFISEQGPFSIYQTLQQFEKPNINWEIKAALALPFGKNIGDGLTPYRRAFFEELQKLDPSIAEQKWQSVRRALIGNERQGVIPPELEAEYPRNIQEAIEIYT